MDLGLNGKVALVTGVSRGIGFAVAQTLTAEGVRVAGISRTAPPPIDGLTHLTLDMSDAEAPAQAVNACVDQLGKLDILVNNVGSGQLAAGFADESDDIWAKFWELNLMSAIRTSRAALPHLVETRGVIVNISSVNGELPETGIYSYSATKAAMNNVTLGLAREYGRRGVRVVGVAPGPVSTPLWLGEYGVAAQASAMGAGEPADIVAEAERAIPIGRFSTPDEIASAVAFLASSRAGSINGTTVRIDGGLTPTV
ncbi:MAG TPA: SDR family oxidoreductase [Mycobacteriales bacterium]|nr:SDR family oxidoreductase [Mycobacteriales bacterium]